MTLLTQCYLSLLLFIFRGNRTIPKTRLQFWQKTTTVQFWFKFKIWNLKRSWSNMALMRLWWPSCFFDTWSHRIIYKGSVNLACPERRVLQLEPFSSNRLQLKRSISKIHKHQPSKGKPKPLRLKSQGLVFSNIKKNDAMVWQNNNH